MENNIQIRFVDLTKRFGNFTAVSRINLELYEGEILGFLGPNGAGKSTTMKMLAKLLRPTEGYVEVKDPRNGKMIKLTNQNKDFLLNNVGFLIESPSFYDDMTPRQVLTYFAKLKGYDRKKIKKRVEKVVRDVGMSEWIDKKFKTFSKGMTQKIGIASSYVHDPDILVLDEPHSGLDPQARQELRNLILRLKNERNKTLFISSHLLFEISEIADRVAIISHGKLAACDNIEVLEQQAQKSTIYLELLNFKQKIKVEEGIITDSMKKIKKLVKPLTGVDESEVRRPLVKYNPDKMIFEILFNGESKRQYDILTKLHENGFKIIDFSVPKGNLLEDLYLDLIKKTQFLRKKDIKGEIKMEKAF